MGMQASYCPCRSSDPNAIYAERAAGDHLGVPDVRSRFPSGLTKMVKMTLFGILGEHSDKWFDLQVLLINHSDCRLYHVHVYGVEVNEQLTGSYPLTTMSSKDSASSQPKSRSHPSPRASWSVDLKLFWRRYEIVFSHLVAETAGDDLVWYPQRRLHLDISCAFSGSKHKGSGLFLISTSTRKTDQTKRAISLLKAAKPNFTPPRDTPGNTTHWWVHLGSQRIVIPWGPTTRGETVACGS